VGTDFEWLHEMLFTLGHGKIA